MKKTLLAILLWGAIAWSQSSVALSGTVYDAENRGKPGVIVSLSVTGLADTTDADGKWSLQGLSTGVRSSVMQHHNISWNGYALNMELVKTSDVLVQYMDLKGRQLFSPLHLRLTPGSQHIVIPEENRAQTGILRVTVGSESFVFLAGAHGSQALRSQSGVQASALALAATPQEMLVYKLQGQIITEDKINTYIEAGITKWIQEHTITSTLIPDTMVAVDSIYAWFDGGTMSSVRIARMGYQKTTNQISGRVFTVKSITGDVYDFRVWLNVLGTTKTLKMHKTGVSDTISFTSDFGSIAVPDFKAGNVLPYARPNVLSAEVSVGDSVGIRVNVGDTLQGSVLNWWYSWNGGAFLPAVDTLRVVAPYQIGAIPYVIRVQDSDSNLVEWGFTYNGVVQDVPTASIQGPDSILVNESANYSVQTNQKYGSISLIRWNTGSGWVSSSQPISLSWPQLGVNSIIAEVTDDDGNVVMDTLVVHVISQSATITGLKTLDSVVVDSILRFSAVDREGVAKIIAQWGDGKFDTLVGISQLTHAYGTANLTGYNPSFLLIDSLGDTTHLQATIVVKRALQLTGTIRIYQQVNPVPGAVVELLGVGLKDTVDENGNFAISNDTLGAAELGSQLVIRVLYNGDEISRTTLTSGTQSFALSYNPLSVSGSIGDGRWGVYAVKSIWFRYTNINTGDTSLIRLSWSPDTKTYSGTAYVLVGSIANPSLYGYVIGKDSLTQLRAESQTKIFSLSDGFLNFPVFSADNAMPYFSARVDSVSINDTIKLNATAADSFGGTITDWEYRIGTGAWTSFQNNLGIAIAPSSENLTYPWQIRAIDNSGNVVVDSGMVRVLKDAPVLTWKKPASVLSHISYPFVIVATQLFGTLTYEWSVDNGAYFAGTDTLKTSFSTVATHTLTARVKDDDGNIATYSIPVAVHDDKPIITGEHYVENYGIDYDVDYLQFNDSNGISSIDWDFGDGSAHLLNTTTANHTWPMGTYHVQVIAKDLDGLADTASFTLFQGEYISDSRDNRVYKVAKIGTQIWMAENLNYGVIKDSSVDQANYVNGEKYCKDYDPTCSLYGGLYQWAEAMGISSTYLTSQFATNEAVQYKGLCPTGFHVPSSRDWYRLESYYGLSQADSASQAETRGNAIVLGQKLKSPDYWDVEGLNSEGFNALPIVQMNNYIDDYYLGDPLPFTGFWTASNSSTDPGFAIGRMLYASDERLQFTDDDKHFARSVRCVADSAYENVLAIASRLPNTPIAKGGSIQLLAKGSHVDFRSDGQFAWSVNGGAYIAVTNANSSYTTTLSSTAGKNTIILRVTSSIGQVAYDTLVVWGYDTFTDSRDSKVYPQITVGTQTWMAANLNYGAQVSATNSSTITSGYKYCYGNTAANCDTLGGMYTWNAALALSTTCLSSDCSASIATGNYKGVCPTSWHLPKPAELTTLANYLVANGIDDSTALMASGASVSLNGTDKVGLAGLNSGFWTISGNVFTSKGSYFMMQVAAQSAIYSGYVVEKFHIPNTVVYNKNNAFAVRCIHD